MSDLPHVIDFVEGCAEQAGVNPSARFDLQLAVEEACTNVIQHAYGGSGGDFEVCFETTEHDVVITLHDHGQPFDPARVTPPDIKRPLTERRVGGLGLYLMAKLMDEIRFNFAPDGNTLTMIKRDVIGVEPADV
ncbi:MAG TPA: ATP-binding protein [Anaerolineae bacterium]